MEVTEQKQPETSTTDLQSDIDLLMNQYNKPAKSIEVIIDKPTEPTKVTVSPSNVPPVVTPNSGADPDAPFGRYMKGKKKGQPRTSPYTGSNPKYLPPPPAPVQPAAPPALSGMLIDGGLFLTLVNLVVPMIIALGNNTFEKDKSKHIKPEKLQLSKEQLRELDPLCDAVMKQISMTGDPKILLFIGLAAAYGLNFMAVKMSQK